MNAFHQLDFLIGSWSSPVSGQTDEGVTGSSTFHYDLDQNILIRKSRAEFAPEPGQDKGLVHEDLLVIYQQPGEVNPRAIYFDNEGHTIHYKVSFPTGQKGVIFDSDGSATSPRARLVYELGPDGTLRTEFFVAPPGGELVSHVKGVIVKE